MKFFGCIDRPGHYWWDETLNHAWKCPEDQALKKIDTGYCPKDTAFQTDGEAALVHDNGYTILAFWDRSIDSRPGSNAAFAEEGVHSFDDMMTMAREKFPSLMKRFTIVLVRP